MKKIKFTDGCPNDCKYCYEPTKMKYYSLRNNLKEIEIHKDIQIQDMNFLANPNAKRILKLLSKKKYEFTCGIDFRRLNQEICNLMKERGFKKVRWAWDYGFSQQKIHQKVWKMFKKAGYKSEDLSVFMIVNWKIPYVECCKKLDLLKVWNVKVNDCCFDGGYKRAKPKDWNIDQIKRFRAMCRKHNQMVLFKIDPELR